ncbi:MAG TPA: RNB domain-containing ribonuclease [Chthonomonadaceae bacterium]|nr:RNB domain-containing ribonuclease [Chthonomonadaceae bacterium]
MTTPPASDFLRNRARQAMIEAGFEPEFPREAQQEAQEAATEPLPHTADIQDLRGLLWSSIDNDESRDLDQIEVAEQLPDGSIRVRVGIADVDTFAPRDTPLDKHAFTNGMTVYTGVTIFPMLPEALCTQASSLLGDAERLAVVIEMTVDAEGEVVHSNAYRAYVRNYAQLAYDAVGDWLEGTGPIPEHVARVPGMEAQLRLQHEAAQRLLAQRKQAGMLDFETVEALPVMREGQVVGLTVPRKNAARSLIENLMVAANITLATFLEVTGMPSIQRVVRAPERWARIVEIARRLGDDLPETPNARALADFLVRRKATDPVHFSDLSLSVVKLLGPGEYAVVPSVRGDTGHFGLAAYRYTHATAPNRRYIDLVLQRLLKAVSAKQAPPYIPAELETIAAHCTQRETAARKVERKIRKVAAAVLMSHRIGNVFDAIVTGTPAGKGTFARLLAPPVEGRILHGEEGLDVGDRVRLRLIHTDPERGFIDFARAD